MADSISKLQETQSQVESQKTSKTRMKLANLAMSTVILWTQVQANDLLSQCDFNHDWKISTRKTYKLDWVPRAVAQKEFKCKLSYENAQLDQEIGQWKIVLAQLDMSLENLQKELREVEAKLSKNKADLSKNKAELEKKRKWLKKQIEKIIKNSINISKPPRVRPHHEKSLKPL